MSPPIQTQFKIIALTSKIFLFFLNRNRNPIEGYHLSTFENTGLNSVFIVSTYYPESHLFENVHVEPVELCYSDSFY